VQILYLRILSIIYESMKKKMLSIASHLGMFIVIEILFVFAILHEFPEISLMEKIGVVHVSYWILLILAWIVRESLKKFWQKFIATYFPVVFHILGHIYVWMATIESVNEHHHEQSTLWMIIATISLWIMIFVWERLLHRNTHCESHHISLHKHCKED